MTGHIAREIVLQRHGGSPEADGYYAVLQSGAASPCIAYWSARDGWRFMGRKLQVEAYAGPLTVEMEARL